MLQKASQKKRGGHLSILARWLSDDRLQKVVVGHWMDCEGHHAIIALENHRYVATRAERIRHSEHWILKLNQDCPQQPLNQRPDFAKRKENASDYTKNIWQGPSKNIEPFLEANKFEGIEEYDYAVDPRAGWRF